MKKTLLKGLTVVTLLVCLIMALAGCGNKDDGDFKEAKPVKGELKVPFIVTDEQVNNATDFFKGMIDNLKTPFVKDGNKLLTLKGKMEVNKSDKALFEFDTTNKVYVDFDVKLAVDMAKTNNKSQCYINVGVSGKQTGATDKLTIDLYYDAEFGNAIVAVEGSKKAIKFNETVKVGSVDDLVGLLNDLGINKDINISNKIDSLLTELDTAVGKFIGKIPLKTLLEQQVKQLLTKMLYNGNTPIWTKNNNAYSLSIDSKQFVSATRALFERGGKIYADNKYDPKVDYVDANNNNAPYDKNTDDALNNDSDAFFKKAGPFASIIALLKEEASVDPAVWGQKFDIVQLNNNKEVIANAVPVSLSMGLTATDTGFNNGNFKFEAKKGTCVAIPSKLGTQLFTNTLSKDVYVNVHDVEVSATTLTDVNEKLDTNEKIDKAKINTDVTFIGNMGFNGTVSATVNNKVTTYDYTLKSNVDLFALLNIKTATKGENIVKNAFEEFELVVKDSQGKVIYSATWDNTNKQMNIKDKDNTTKTLTASKLATMIADKRNSLLGGSFDIMGLKDMLPKISNGVVTLNKSILGDFVTDVFGDAEAINLTVAQGVFTFNGKDMQGNIK